MKLKHKALTAAFLIAVIIFFQACKKFDFFSKQSKTQEFTLAEAKEWYYGVFKKSEEFKNSLPGNEFDATLVQKANSNNRTYPTVKYPYWNLGIKQSTASWGIVEFPIMYTLNKISIPGTSQLKEVDRQRVYKAISNRLLIIKSPNGSITTRIVNYIPEKSYLERKGSDISDERLLKLHKEFTGYIFIRKWNEQILAGYKIENGDITGIMKFNAGRNSAVQNSNRTNMGETCTDECVPIKNLVCVGDTNGGGDKPPPEPVCPEFTGECEWVTTCVPDPDEPPIDLPEDEDYEDDLCILLGICDPPPPPEEDQCTIDANNDINNVLTNSNPVSEPIPTLFGNEIVNSFGEITREKPLEWIAYRGYVVNYHWWFNSFENGVQKKVNNVWKWKSIQHDHFSLEGNVLGTATISLDNPSIITYSSDELYANIKHNFTITVALDCGVTTVTRSKRSSAERKNIHVNHP
jgi:hypothetical protein